jgi:hypothetical protein
MKNKYEVRGDITAIFINSPKHGDLETIISTAKLEVALSFPNTWYARYEPKTNSFYAVGNMTIEKNKRRTFGLHQWVMSRPKNMVIDHLNHETLNNLDENLRVVTKAQNSQNRIGSTRANVSGVRGVRWSKREQKWQVRMKVNGKESQFGTFKTVGEAEELSKEIRKKYMPFAVN